MLSQWTYWISASNVFLCFIIFKVQEEFVKNMENTSVESLIQKLAESKGTGKERPGNTAKSLTHGINLWHWNTLLLILLIRLVMSS